MVSYESYNLFFLAGRKGSECTATAWPEGVIMTSHPRVVVVVVEVTIVVMSPSPALYRLSVRPSVHTETVKR